MVRTEAGCRTRGMLKKVQLVGEASLRSENARTFPTGNLGRTFRTSKRLTRRALQLLSSSSHSPRYSTGVPLYRVSTYLSSCTDECILNQTPDVFFLPGLHQRTPPTVPAPAFLYSRRCFRGAASTCPFAGRRSVLLSVGFPPRSTYKTRTSQIRPNASQD